MRVFRLSHSDHVAMSHPDEPTTLLDEGSPIDLERLVCSPRQLGGHTLLSNVSKMLTRWFAASVNKKCERWAQRHRSSAVMGCAMYGQSSSLRRRRITHPCAERGFRPCNPSGLCIWGAPRPGRWNGAPDLLPPQHRAVDVFRPLKSHLGYPTQLSRAGVDPVAAQSAGTIADTYTLEVRILGYRPPGRGSSAGRTVVF
jgi:hypothetical protein